MQVRLPRSLRRISGLSAVVHCTSALHDASKSLAQEKHENREKTKTFSHPTTKVRCFYVSFTVHFGIILDNDQLDAQLLYFIIRLL